jgi:hypothetical protein
MPSLAFLTDDASTEGMTHIGAVREVIVDDLPYGDGMIVKHDIMFKKDGELIQHGIDTRLSSDYYNEKGIEEVREEAIKELSKVIPPDCYDSIVPLPSYNYNGAEESFLDMKL